MGKIVTYNGKVVKGSSGMIASVPGVPAGLPAKTMRFDFHYDHFNPIEGLIDHSAQGFIWTHVHDDVYDFHYDNPIWVMNYGLSQQTGLFNVYAYKGGGGTVYPFGTHDMDVIDSNLSGVMAVTSLFNSARGVRNCVLKNTGDIVDAYALFYHNLIKLETINSLDLHSVNNIRYMMYGCKYLTSELNITLSGHVTDCSSAFYGCTKVPGGALDLYNQLSSQETLPSSYSNCFKNCGRGTTTGAAELAQIPTSWGGTMAEGNE